MLRTIFISIPVIIHMALIIFATYLCLGRERYSDATSSGFMNFNNLIINRYITAGTRMYTGSRSILCIYIQSRRLEPALIDPDIANFMYAA